MNKHEIKVAKTARYFTLGSSNNVREVWFLCHGYAQLAPEFLRLFTALEKPGRILVAPEGLHRFYRKGGRGEVAASWMTSEDRQRDIEDYTTMLNAVADEVLQSHGSDVRVIVLGFSQGAATVCRWLSRANFQASGLVLWCGFFPPDMQPVQIPAHTKLTLVSASNDRFITPEENQQKINELRSAGVQFEHLPFIGEHEIMKEPLLRLEEKLGSL
jgi:predicted esterase